jgi:hypothetical protein
MSTTLLPYLATDLTEHFNTGTAVTLLGYTYTTTQSISTQNCKGKPDRPQRVLGSRILLGAAPDEEDFLRRFQRAGSKSLVAMPEQHPLPVAMACGRTASAQAEM